MMLKLFVLSILALNAYSIKMENSCSNKHDAFNQHLSCLDNEFNVKSNPQEFETEFHNDALNATEACFTFNRKDVQATGKCFFNSNALRIQQFAFSPQGPLRSCPLCLRFASASVNGIIGADKETSECVRKIVYPAIARESIHCIKRSNSNFIENHDDIMIPDFERIISQDPRIVLDTVSIELMQQLFVSNCAKRNTNRAINTVKCLSNPPVEGYRQKHCETANTCLNSMSSDCRREVISITPVACSCFKSGGDEIQARLANITQGLSELFNSHQHGAAVTRFQIDQCQNLLTDQLKTDANNWLEVIQSAIDTCSPTPAALPKFDQLLRLFCGVVLKDMIRLNSTDNLQTAFIYLSGLIEALTGRVARFCPGEYCNLQSQ